MTALTLVVWLWLAGCGLLAAALWVEFVAGEEPGRSPGGPAVPHPPPSGLLPRPVVGAGVAGTREGRGRCTAASYGSRTPFDWEVEQ